MKFKGNTRTLIIIVALGAVCLACGAKKDAATISSSNASSSTGGTGSSPLDSGFQGKAQQTGCGAVPVNGTCPATPFTMTLQVLECEQTYTNCSPVTTFTPNADGTFSVPLKEGYYLIQLPPTPTTAGSWIPINLPPVTVLVLAHQYTTDVTIQATLLVP